MSDPAGTPAIAQHQPRSAQDFAIVAARLALAKIANGNPEAREIARAALDDINTLVPPKP